MEMWLILALVCAVLAAVAGFFDNSLVDNYFNNSRPQSQKCFFGPLYAIIAILIFLIYPIFNTVPSFPAKSALVIALSGVILSLSSIPYYLALKSENTTGAVIFFQLEPVFYLILGLIFLGEKISSIQLIAFFILLLAPLLIIFSTRKRGKKLEYKAAFFILIHLIVYSFSYILFLTVEKDLLSADIEMPMALTIAFLLVGRAVFDITLVVIFKKWRKDFFRILKKSKRKALIPLFSSATLWLSEDAILRIAMILGPVAVISAVQSVSKLILTFLFGIIFTLISPKFGREKLDKRTVLVHLIATVIAAFGIVLVNSVDLFGG